MEPTKISVIIPTFNAAGSLGPLVSKLQSQKQAVDQILVIDSGSTDNTEELARELEVKFVTIEPDSFDHGATRNLAADHVDGDILIYMTQDALPANDEVVGNLVKPLKDPEIVISYARQKAVPEASLSEQYLRLANYPPFSVIKAKEDIPAMGIKVFQNSNVCAAYRRKEFDLLGGFPHPVPCNEDMLYAARAVFAGYKVAYTAEALVWHTHCLNCRHLFRRYFDIAASLSCEPRIRALGKVEAKGFEFFRDQLAFIGDRGKLYQLPIMLLESGAKYLGYKAGENHNRFPKGLKKYLGLNTLYWSRLKG